MFEVTIKTTKETQKYINDNPKEFNLALEQGFAHGVKLVESKIKKSFGKTGKPNVVTGHLRRSIYSKVVDRGRTISGIIGSNLVYAAIQEEGGVIKAKRSPYLKFRINNRWVNVQQVTIPARPYIEPAIRSSLKEIGTLISDNIKKRMERL